MTCSKQKNLKRLGRWVLHEVAFFLWSVTQLVRGLRYGFFLPVTLRDFDCGIVRKPCEEVTSSVAHPRYVKLQLSPHDDLSGLLGSSTQLISLRDAFTGCQDLSRAVDASEYVFHRRGLHGARRVKRRIREYFFSGSRRVYVTSARWLSGPWATSFSG